MRFPRKVSSWLGLVTVSCSLSGGLLAAADTAPRSWSYTHNGVTYFAVGLQGEAAASAGSVDHWIVVDTSASQTGEYRTRTLETLKAFLAKLPSGDRVRISAVDAQLSAIVGDYVAVNDPAVQAGVSQLAKRIPLGASNLSVTLREMLNDSDRGAKSAARTIVYLGDGISAAQSLDAEELQSIVSDAREQNIAVYGFLVGPRVDLQLSGILALQTGGMIHLDADSGSELGFEGVSPAGAGALLARETHVAVQPAGKVSGGSVRFVDQNVPPVRSDRETIVMGTTEAKNVALEVQQGGVEQQVAVELAPADENAFLKTVWERGQKDQGLSIPFAGAEVLQMAKKAHDSQADRLASVVRSASETKQYPQAKNALAALQQIAPKHKEMTSLVQLVSRQTGETGDAAKNDAANTGTDQFAPRPGSIIEAEQERRRVAAQKLQHESSQAIELARRTLRTDPDAALDLITRQLSTVLASTDVNPEIREDLRRRLSAVLGELSSQRDVLVSEQADAQRRLAVVEANRRLIDKDVLDEQRMRQLIDRVRALLEEGAEGDANAFEEAEAVARSALLMRPGLKEPTAALFVSEAAGQLDKQFRLRNLRNDKFLETLHQVELSHVPFPDEPPIVYPPAEIWRQIYEERVVRRDWANVDLKRYSKRELEIKAALERTLDFPISIQQETLQGIIDTLKTRLNIDILPDKKVLEEAAISMDTPEFDLEINQVKVKTALKLLLQQKDLTYVLEDEVLKITTAEAAMKKRFIRVYYVADLIIPIQTPSGGGGAGFGGGGGGGFGGFGGGGGGGGFGGGGGGGGFGGGGFGNVMDVEVDRAALPAGDAQGAPAQKAVEGEADRMLKGLLGAADRQLNGQVSAVKKKPA